MCFQGDFTWDPTPETTTWRSFPTSVRQKPTKPNVTGWTETAQVNARIRTRTYTHMHAHTHARTHTHAHAHAHTCTHTHTHTHTHAHTCTHTHTHAHTHTCTHTHTHTHAHTHTHTAYSRESDLKPDRMWWTSDADGYEIESIERECNLIMALLVNEWKHFKSSLQHWDLFLFVDITSSDLNWAKQGYLDKL